MIFAYQSDPTDPDTGLVDMGARLYETTQGRFASRDTLFGDWSDPTNLNEYVYGNDGPLSYTDPTGMRGTCDGCDDPTSTAPSLPRAPPASPQATAAARPPRRRYVETQVQRTAGVGGTYAAERAVARLALQAAGYSDSEIAYSLARVDAYFTSLGPSPESPLRIPGNRIVP